MHLTDFLAIIRSRFWDGRGLNKTAIANAVASMEQRAEKDPSVLSGTNFPDSWLENTKEE